MFSKTVKLLPVARQVQYSAVEKCRRGCTSSLFITGDKASESFSALTPHLDLDARFDNMDALSKNVALRGLKVDLKLLKSSWDHLQSVKKFKASLEKERLMNTAKFKFAQSPRMIEDIRAEGLKIRGKLKSASQEMWEAEKKAIIGGLSLPNDISPETPLTDEEKIVHEFEQKPDSRNCSPSHLEVSKKLGLVEYYDASYYFLKDEAAQFEMGISYLIMDKLRADGFIPMSNSDFGKSLTVEGVGLNPRDANSVFTLEKDSDMLDPNARLHLVGGASLVSFCAYHAKSVTSSKNLPLRYVTMGRHYNPESNDGLQGLFSTWQSSAVETFVATVDSITAMEEFKTHMKIAIDLYESLGYHFRVQYLPPKNLKPWESLRASFQMYSRNLNCYIEVGSLSLCNDYISKRLLMCYGTKSNEPVGFMHIISGTVVSVPRLLGCVLEYDGENFKVPLNVMSQVI